MDDSQIEVPPSFSDLYVAPGGYRLKTPLAEVRARYELCEDMAQALTERASETLHRLGITEADVLGRMLQGLQTEGSPLQHGEARWVVRRLAELLGWEDPGPEMA